MKLLDWIGDESYLEKQLKTRERTKQNYEKEETKENPTSNIIGDGYTTRYEKALLLMRNRQAVS